MHTHTFFGGVKLEKHTLTMIQNKVYRAYRIGEENPYYININKRNNVLQGLHKTDGGLKSLSLF